MSLFYFILKAGRKTYPDTECQEFVDEADALAHARAVARELMRNREAKTAHWRIQVCDDYLQLRQECLFVDVDQRLEGLPADLQVSIAAVARTTANMSDAFRNIDATMADLRETLNRMDVVLSSISRGALL